MADRITTERLAELRAIAEKATPGPWRWGEHVDPTVALKEMLEAGAPLTVATLPNTGAKPGSCLFICLLLGQREEVDFDNAALIAAAPELLSALLSERAEVERLGKVAGDKSYWVVEFIGSHPRVPGVTNYAMMHDVQDPAKQGFMDWTGDIHQAMKFHRERDATLFAKMYFWSDFHECVRITEHIDAELKRREAQP